MNVFLYLTSFAVLVFYTQTATLLAATGLQEPGGVNSTQESPRLGLISTSNLGRFADPFFGNVIELSDEQRQKILGIIERGDRETEKTLGDNTRLSFAERRPILDKYGDEIDSVLSPKQRLMSQLYGSFDYHMDRTLTFSRNSYFSDDLEISAEQRVALDNLMGELVKRVLPDIAKSVSVQDRNSYSALEPQFIAIRDSLETLREDVRNSVQEILQTAQWDRVQQVELQSELSMRGALVFTNPRVQRRLKISPAQLESLQNKEFSKEWLSRDASIRGYRTYLNVLSSTQRKEWESMLGTFHPSFRSWGYDLLDESNADQTKPPVR